MDNNILTMFALQGLLTLVIFFFGFVLNGLRSSMKSASDNMMLIASDLKLLNDAVLGKYLTRDDSERTWSAHRQETEVKWTAQRSLDHELRTLVTTAMIDIAALSGKPYNYTGKGTS